MPRKAASVAKRFTDSEKWKKSWFRSLSNNNKVFWQFILDNCNFSGIWDVDFEFAAIFCGEINETEIREIFKKQYVEIDGGKRWFIKDFIDFQYGDLNPNNNLHRSVITVLKKAGVFEGLTSPCSGTKDKVKDKVKEEVVIGDVEFEAVWKKYPNKDGRKEALKHFLSTVITKDDLIDINSALDNYLKSEKVKKNFIKNGSTWFNNWRDWIQYKPPNEQKSSDRNRWKSLSNKECTNCRGEGAVYAPGSGQFGKCGCVK